MIDKSKSMFVKYHGAIGNIYGNINLAGDEVMLELHSYGLPFSADRGGEVTVLLQDLRYATLLNCRHLPGFQESCSEVRYYETIYSSEVVIGRKAWCEHDRISEVDFRFRNHNGSLYAPDLRDHISHKNDGNKPDQSIFSCETRLGEAIVYHDISVHGWERAFKAGDVRMQFKFTEPIFLNDIDDFFGCIRSFFSLMFGILAPIDEFLIVAEHANSGGAGVPGDRCFDLIWGAPHPSNDVPRDRSRPACLMYCRNSAERDAFAHCLASWVRQWPEWKGPASAALYALSQQEVFDPNRLINACKWIESTPGVEQNDVIDKNIIKKIVKAAENCANELVV